MDAGRPDAGRPTPAEIMPGRKARLNLYAARPQRFCAPRGPVEVEPWVKSRTPAAAA